MTTATTAIRRPPRWLTRTLFKPGNVLPALVWMFLVFNQPLNSALPPPPSPAGLVLINTVAMILFVVRRDPTKVAGKIDGAIALAGTFSVSFLKDAGQLQDAELLPTLIQAAGVVGGAGALSPLGRSFGVAPADRGRVRHGPYRFVRHPIYAFETLFFIGYLAAVPTPRTFIVIAVWAVLQVVRIIREERIIGGYDEYRQGVRWRLIPFVW